MPFYNPLKKSIIKHVFFFSPLNICGIITWHGNCIEQETCSYVCKSFLPALCLGESNQATILNHTTDKARWRNGGFFHRDINHANLSTHNHRTRWAVTLGLSCLFWRSPQDELEHTYLTSKSGTSRGSSRGVRPRPPDSYSCSTA